MKLVDIYMWRCDPLRQKCCGGEVKLHGLPWSEWWGYGETEVWIIGFVECGWATAGRWTVKSQDEVNSS